MSVALVEPMNAWQAVAIAGIRKYHFQTYHREYAIFGKPDESYVLYLFFRFDPRSGTRPFDHLVFVRVCVKPTRSRMFVSIRELILGSGG